MDIKNMTTDQLMDRIEEIRSIADNPGERTTEELEQLSQERSAIDAELECRRNEAARANMRRQQVARGIGARTIDKMGMNTPEKEQNDAEERAQEFAKTRRETIPLAEARAVLVSGGTLATPTGVSGINDKPGQGVSSIVDLVKVENCEGMGSNKVSYVAADTSAAASQTEGNAATGAEPTFGYVTITPTTKACYAQISKQAKKQTPLQYQAKVTSLALKSLRKGAVALINGALAASTLVTEVVADVNSSTHKGKIDENTLRKIVLAYGGDEDVVGGAVLFLNKKDLVAFGDVRGTNEKKAVYEIIPDTDNPNMGVIKDGGMSVRYCIDSGLTEAAGKAQTTSKIKTMYYGNPQCIELDLFSDYEVRVSEDFAITSLMDTIVGDVEIGADVVVSGGLVCWTLPTNP